METNGFKSIQFNEDGEELLYSDIYNKAQEEAERAHINPSYADEIDWSMIGRTFTPEQAAVNAANPDWSQTGSMNEAAKMRVREGQIEQNGMGYIEALGITSNTFGMDLFHGDLTDSNPPLKGYELTIPDAIQDYQDSGLAVEIGALQKAITDGDIRSPEDWEDWKERHALYKDAMDTLSLHNGFTNFFAAIPFAVLDPVNIPEGIVMALTGGASLTTRLGIGAVTGAATGYASEKLIQQKAAQYDTDAVMFSTSIGFAFGSALNGAFGKRTDVIDPDAPNAPPTSSHPEGASYTVTDGTVYTPDAAPYVPLTEREVAEVSELAKLKRSTKEVKELKGIKKGKEYDLKVAKEKLAGLDKALEEVDVPPVPKAPVGKRTAQKKAQKASKEQEGVARAKSVAARQEAVDSIDLIEAELAGIEKVTIENNRARAAEASLSRDATERDKRYAATKEQGKGSTKTVGGILDAALEKAGKLSDEELGVASPDGTSTTKRWVNGERVDVVTSANVIRDETDHIDMTPEDRAALAEDIGLGTHSDRQAEEVFVDELNEAGVTDPFTADTDLDDIPTSNRYSITLLTNLTKSSLNAVRWVGHSVDTLVSSASGYVHKGATLKEVRRKLSGSAGTLGKDINLAQQELGYGFWARGKQFKQFMLDLETQYRLYVNEKELTDIRFEDIINKRAEYDKLKKELMEKAGIDVIDDHLLRAWNFDKLIGTPDTILHPLFTNAIISKAELKLGRVLDDIELLKAQQDAIEQVSRLKRITSRNAGTTSLGKRHIIDLDESVVDEYLMSNVHSIISSDVQNLSGRIATGTVFGFVDDVGKTKFLKDVRAKADIEIAERNLDEAARNKELLKLDKQLKNIDLVIKHVWETAMQPHSPNGIANNIKTFMSDLSTGVLAPGFGTVSAASEIAEVFGSGSLAAVFKAGGRSLREGLNQIKRLPASEEYYRFISTMVDAHHGYSGSSVGRFVNDAGDVPQANKGFILKSTEAFRNFGIRVGGVADVADTYKVTSAIASIDNVLNLDVTTLSKRQLRQFNTAKYSLDDIIELQAFNRANPLERLDEAGKFKHYALWDLPEDILLKFSNYVANRADHAIINGDKIHMPTPFSANDPLTVLLSQFLSFPAQAQESLLNKNINQGDIRTGVGVVFSAATLATMLVTKEEMEVKLGYRREDKRRYDVFDGNEEGYANLALDVFSKIGMTSSVSYLMGQYEATVGEYSGSKSAFTAYGGFNASKLESMFKLLRDRDQTALSEAMKLNFAMGYSTAVGKAVTHELNQ